MHTNALSPVDFIVIFASQAPQSTSTVALVHSRAKTPELGAVSLHSPMGVPCGRYLWDLRNAELVDWLVDTHLTGDVSPSELVNGIFLDDDWSPTGGAAENCLLNECKHDMGLSQKDVADITSGWCNMMRRAQAKVLQKGGKALHII